jgi:hypothetical protein
MTEPARNPHEISKASPAKTKTTAPFLPAESSKHSLGAGEGFCTGLSRRRRAP